MAEIIQHPNVLTIAGVDPSGGAGVLADIKAMSALGGYGCAVIAALTAQNTQAVTAIQSLPSNFLQAQIDTLFQDVTIHAIKIGMLGQTNAIETVAQRLSVYPVPHVVLDPVMVAKSGDHLLENKAVGALKEMMLPLATVITPNLPEAAVLLNQSAVETPKAMYKVAERLRELLPHSGERWVFLKGGHLLGDLSVDLLYNGDKMLEYPSPKVPTKNTHGTGCTLSAAIATLLPQHANVPLAIEAAKRYITQAILSADQLQVGKGHGPVHHFHAWWS